MRLLNVETYKLEFFQNAAEAPPYAILSHRWQEEEVLFEDIQDQPENEEVKELRARLEDLESKLDAFLGRGSNTRLDDEDYRDKPRNNSGERDSDDFLRSHPHLTRAIKKKGWPKVLGCCKNAQVHGVHYVWIDTCCIDQKSSSELSESINSMFSWYQDAKYCIAYLFDVKKSIHEPEGQDQFFFSDWFRRGWTLQELIAPKAVTFYRSDWYLLGLRYNLRGQISAITNIDESVLCHGGLERLSTFSVAAKLAWAAKRQTTRPEDRAYSLMGLFGVNMPTLYGEGEAAAFFRLQIGIFEYSSDQSMLAWQIRTHSTRRNSEPRNLSLLAPSVDAFEDAGFVRSMSYHSMPFFDRFAVMDDSLGLMSVHRMRIRLLVRFLGNTIYEVCLPCGNSKEFLSVRVAMDQPGETIRLWPSLQYVESGSMQRDEWAFKDVYVSRPSVDRPLSTIPSFGNRSVDIIIDPAELLHYRLESELSSWKPTSDDDGYHIFTLHRADRHYRAIIFRTLKTQGLFAIILLLTSNTLTAAIVTDLEDNGLMRTLSFNTPDAKHYNWHDIAEANVVKGRFNDGTDVSVSVEIFQKVVRLSFSNHRVPNTSIELA